MIFLRHKNAVAVVVNSLVVNSKVVGLALEFATTTPALYIVG
jgi:hypothetical protein